MQNQETQQRSCIQCQKQTESNMLAALCCLTHQYCIKCTVVEMKQHQMTSSCYCCPRFKSITYTNANKKNIGLKTAKVLTVGPVVQNEHPYNLQYTYITDPEKCTEVSYENFHSIDHVSFIEQDGICIKGFELELIMSNYVKVDRKSFFEVTDQGMNKLRKLTPVYEISIPIYFHVGQEGQTQTFDVIKIQKQYKLTPKQYSDAYKTPIDSQGNLTRNAKNMLFIKIQRCVQYMLTDFLNSQGVLKQLDNQFFYDLIIRRKDLLLTRSNCFNNDNLIDIIIEKKQGSLLITLKERKTQEAFWFE